MTTPLAIQEIRKEACQACDQHVEIGEHGTRCKLRGGAKRSCPRCWARFDAVDKRTGCPRDDKGWYADAPAKPASEPAKPVPVPLVVFPVAWDSPEWNANMQACRQCRFYERGHPEKCKVDRKQCSTHAIHGDCPRKIQPYYQGMAGSAIVTGTPKGLPNTSPPPAMTASELYTLFDHVRVISLAKRSDRLNAFWHGLQGWPHRTPVVFEAVDGSTLPVPAGWKSGAGAYGCKLSHVAVLREALADPNCNSVLVLEDDALPSPNYSEEMGQFMRLVPIDWSVLWLGGHELGGHSSKQIRTGLRLMTRPHRCHAYAIRGRGHIEAIVQQMDQCGEHIDHCMGKFLGERFSVYAPSPRMLFAQGANNSDIDGKAHATRWWGPQPVPGGDTLKEYPQW